MKQVIHEERQLSFFEKYLTLWVIGCIALGILFGKLFPRAAIALDSISVLLDRHAIICPNLPDLRAELFYCQMDQASVSGCRAVSFNWCQ